MARGEADGGRIMLCLSPDIHVDVTFTSTTYLKIVADLVHLFMAMVLPDGSGLFKQDKGSYYTLNSQ